MVLNPSWQQRFRVGNQYMSDEQTGSVSLYYQFKKVTLTFVPSVEIGRQEAGKWGRSKVRRSRVAAIIMLKECSLLFAPIVNKPINGHKSTSQRPLCVSVREKKGARTLEGSQL